MTTLFELAQKYGQGAGNIATSAKDVYEIVDWYNENHIPAPVDMDLADIGIPNVIIFGRTVMVRQ